MKRHVRILSPGTISPRNVGNADETAWNVQNLGVATARVTLDESFVSVQTGEKRRSGTQDFPQCGELETRGPNCLSLEGCGFLACPLVVEYVMRLKPPASFKMPETLVNSHNPKA